MNERIKEIAKKAGLSYLYDYDADGHAMVCSEKDIKKFAELIVRECFGCIDIMEKIAHSTNASIPKDYDKHTYLETLDTVRGLFKTHFGVEE